MAQLDLPGEIVVEGGRYVVKPAGQPDGDADVLTIRTLGASRQRSSGLFGRGKQQAQADGEPTLRVTRVSLVKARPFATEAAAAAWLEDVADSEKLARGLAAEVARTLNRALGAHRVSAGDPYATDLHHGDALAIRFGYGTGEELAEGRHSDAVEMSERGRQRLLAALRVDVGPQERVAAVLGGRDEVSPAEELLAGVRRALNERRAPEAAVMLEAAARSVERAGPNRARASAAEVRLGLPAPESAPPELAEIRSMASALTKAVREPDS